MNKKLKEKIRESLTSVLPITVIVFSLAMYSVPMPIGTTIMFLAGAAMLIVGMGFFSLGADIAMMPMGEGVGMQFGKLKAAVIAILSFIMGTIITIAEPDLQVLATQVASIPNEVLILTVAGGVGFFLAVAMLRTRTSISLSKMLMMFYAVVFALAAFAPREFIAVAFDSGGVTTGPMTVPFIMALGVGLAASSRGSGSQNDSFGLVSLCSIGPLLAVLLLGIVFDPQDATYTPAAPPNVETTKDVAAQFIDAAPYYIKEVLSAIAPVCVFFLLFQLFTRRHNKRQMLTIGIGFVYTLIGLVLFLTGVNVGFIPVGYLIGSEIASGEYRWALLPLGAVIGYYIVVAEPAVHVLNRQVESVSGGAISQRAMRLSLSLGVAVSLLLSMLRILTGLSIFWLLIPGYAAAMVMTFLTPKIFTGIAFDSGGVASGPMTSTFILPFAMGACQSVGGNILTDAFGVVAMVAMTPLITIQALGMIYGRQMRAHEESVELVLSDEIVEL